MTLEQIMNSPTAKWPIAEKTWDFMSGGELASDFTATAINSGTAAADHGDNGVVVISGAATTDASGGNIQTKKKSIYLAKGKCVAGLARVKFSHALLAKFLFGVTVVDTSALASRPSDGCYIIKTATDAYTFKGGNSVGSSETLTSAYGAIADDTYTYIGFLISQTGDDKGELAIFQDNELLAKLDITSLPTESTGLVLTFEFMSGSSAGTQTCTIDLLGFAKER